MKDNGPSEKEIEEAIARAEAKSKGVAMNRRERRAYASGGRKSAYDQSIWHRMTTKEKRQRKAA